MKYDIVCIGHITSDVRNMMGEKTPFVGGAAYFSPCAAARSGRSVYVVTKMAARDRASLGVFDELGIGLRVLPSEATTSMENIFLSPDPDDRKLRLISVADSFDEVDLADLPEASVYHIAALFRGEIPDSVIPALAQRGRLALDVQSVLRYFADGDVRYADWAEKERYLPMTHYVKADSLEITVIAGTDDREKAAKILFAMGGKEIVITRQDEVLVYDGAAFYHAPFDPVRLDGRAGRGDTCFLAYIAWRKDHGIDESTHYAAALTSIKMESPGPFAGSIDLVLARMRRQAY